MINKKGFSLAETLITLAVIGFLAAVVLPMLNIARPNTEKTMLKKAYMTTVRVVVELMQDDILYPDFDEGGFKDLLPAGKRPSPYFIKNVTDKLNTVGNVDGNSTFYTTDGIYWDLTGIFADETSTTITVDVNGQNVAPNCLDGSTGCNRPDRFNIGISPDGHISVIGDKAKEYLESTRIQ